MQIIYNKATGIIAVRGNSCSIASDRLHYTLFNSPPQQGQDGRPGELQFHAMVHAGQTPPVASDFEVATTNAVIPGNQVFARNRSHTFDPVTGNISQTAWVPGNNPAPTPPPAAAQTFEEQVLSQLADLNTRVAALEP